MNMQPTTHTRKVSQYYDRNTWLFNMFGKTGGTRNIHASLWGPGVSTSQEASHYTNRLICQLADQIRNKPARILDLGCGVGASMAYLAGHAVGPLELTGITLSQRQAETGNALSRSIRGEWHILAGDFHQLPETWTGQYDLAYALESFVHSPHPESFFREAARVLTTGGQLAILDTFPTKPFSDHSSPVQELLSDYQAYWKAGHILTTNETEAIASGHGLILTGNDDLTPWVEKDRPRDRWIARFNRRFRPLTTLHPYLHALRGGHAVQCGLQQGWLNYRMLTFQNSPV